MISAIAAFSLLMAGAARAQVTATDANGATNPSSPSLGTPLNQTSDARLITLNSYDDFCLFAPPYFSTVDTTLANGDIQYASDIGNTETEEVAWCTKQRNNARLIPDGTITAVHFVTTPLYVQVRGFGDLTQLNIPYGDYGGELDPHGATGLGNPIGGNVTSNVTGSDVFYQEWMMFVSYNQFCLRICTSENSTYSAAEECQHQIDKLGCDWVMPGDTSNGTFTSCDADSAYPPGVYPVDNGASTSTFAQAFTGTYTQNGQAIGYTIGVDVTPTAAYSTPASSNCVTHTSPANGVSDVVYQGYNATAGAATTTGGAAATSAAASGSSGATSGTDKTTAKATSTKTTTTGSTTGTSTSTSTSGAGVAGAPGVLGLVMAAVAAAL